MTDINDGLDREVYETEDLPYKVEPDDSAPPEYESEYISGEATDTQAARAKFDTVEVNNRLTNFNAVKPMGWTVSTRKESRQEALARLRRELEELNASDTTSSTDDSTTSIQNLLAMHDNISSKSKLQASQGKERAQASSESIEKMSLLEQRLNAVEQRIGSSNAHNLAEEVDILAAKIELVTASPEVIEEVSKRLLGLVASSAEFADASIVGKIDDLFRSMSSINGLSSTLPLVVERLRSLKEIHENAAQVHIFMDEIRKGLGTRQTEIDEWQRSLKGLEERLSVSGQTVNQNTEILKGLLADWKQHD